jgi:flagellar biosynthesis GTPase FlhF
MYEQGLPVHYITYGNGRKFPHLPERRTIKILVTCAVEGWQKIYYYLPTGA